MLLLNKFILVDQFEILKYDGLDIIDATILHYIYQMCKTDHSVVEDNRKSEKYYYLVKENIPKKKRYTWISYKKILEDLPLLPLKNKRALANRILKLVNVGLLFFKLEGNRKTYFAVTPNCEKAFQFKVVRNYSNNKDLKTSSKAEQSKTYMEMEAAGEDA